MIRFLKQKKYISFGAFLLVLALFLPYGLKLAHSLEAHSVVSHCSNFADHLHEKTPHLDHLDNALLTGVDENNHYTPLVVLFQINTPQDFYSFCFVESNYTQGVTRGPPVV